jgi:hypothetical protein
MRRRTTTTSITPMTRRSHGVDVERRAPGVRPARRRQAHRGRVLQPGHLRSPAGRRVGAPLDPALNLQGQRGFDQAWGHVRYVPATGHIWVATRTGGFWVLSSNPGPRVPWAPRRADAIAERGAHAHRLESVDLTGARAELSNLLLHPGSPLSRTLGAGGERAGRVRCLPPPIPPGWESGIGAERTPWELSLVSTRGQADTQRGQKLRLPPPPAQPSVGVTPLGARCFMKPNR